MRLKVIPLFKRQSLSFMTNEEDVVEVTEIVEAKDDDGNDTTDWKALALERQELAKKNFGIAQRYKTKLGKVKDSVVEPKVEPETKPTGKGELDYGQKAYLNSYNIKGADELALVKNWLARTGDELDAVVDDEIFNAKLKSLRDARATKEAIPAGNKRSATPAIDTVDYHIAKGTSLNEIEDFGLRSKVLNARLAKEKNSSSNFSSQSVIM
jgi:hypothetical protein